MILPYTSGTEENAEGVEALWPRRPRGSQAGRAKGRAGRVLRGSHRCQRRPRGVSRRRREYPLEPLGLLPLLGDDPEEFGQCQQDREDDDEHHQADEQATGHVPLAPQQALDLHDDEPAHEEDVEERR